MINAVRISISDPFEFSVLNCRIRLDRDPETGSCSTLVATPAAFCDGMRGSSKNLEFPSSKKEKYFSLQLTRKEYKKTLENLFYEANHIAMQNTPPKQENNTQSRPTRLKITNLYPSFPQLSAHPTRTYLMSPFLAFHTDSIPVKISSNILRNHRFCTKCRACVLPTDSV